ncbi:MAG: hypothetical protein GX568_00615 [Candidatus Gastranaerophilales bacterium]|nr:hypothetical protein [Candidatus Gastranaerophilales bacterium]
MGLIGAKDLLDRALVKQYAKVQTSNLDDSIRINQEEMWNKIALFSTYQKNQINFSKYKKVS